MTPGAERTKCTPFFCDCDCDCLTQVKKSQRFLGAPNVSFPPPESLAIFLATTNRWQLRFAIRGNKRAHCSLAGDGDVCNRTSRWFAIAIFGALSPGGFSPTNLSQKIFWLILRSQKTIHLSVPMPVRKCVWLARGELVAVACADGHTYTKQLNLWWRLQLWKQCSAGLYWVCCKADMLLHMSNLHICWVLLCPPSRGREICAFLSCVTWLEVIKLPKMTKTDQYLLTSGESWPIVHKQEGTFG